MAKYKITITYADITRDPERIVAPICRVFTPDNSYIDSDVYVIGLPGGYGPSVYATNVKGWGELPIPEPYASTSIPFPVPMAQFKLAMVGENNSVEFTVDDYAEAFYYAQVGVALESQGFKVKIEEVAA